MMQFNCHGTKYMGSAHDKVHISYAEFLDKMETEQCKIQCKHKNPDRCLDAILCYQAWMSGCEAELFCRATSRLSYELLNAKNLCDVKQLVETINGLFSASALKENALAEVIRAYCFNCKPSDCGCDCK